MWMRWSAGGISTALATVLLLETNKHISIPQVAVIAFESSYRPGTGTGGWAQLRLQPAKPCGEPAADRLGLIKPFVYATAFNSSLTGVALPGQQGVFTAVTMLNDADTTFDFDNGNMQYAPHNYKQEQMGMITARTALMLSQNVATVALGQMVGFDNVAALAHRPVSRRQRRRRRLRLEPTALLRWKSPGRTPSLPIMASRLSRT